MRVLLTDRFIARVKAEGQEDFFDEKVPGLALRVGKRRRTWCLFHDRRRLTLGAYPSMSLAAARAEAIATKGGGPSQVPTSSPTLATVYETFLAREGPGLRSVTKRRSVFERHILPTFGQRAIGEVRRSEITALLDHIEDHSGPVAAHTALAYLSRLFNWHAARTEDFVSPIVRGMSRTRGTSRERILTDAELRALWRATNNGEPFNRFVRLLLLTATRRNEAAFATGDEFNGSLWTIPPDRYKLSM